MNRLDMTTCQTSIKTDILMQYFGSSSHGYQILDITTVVHSGLN